MTAACVGGAVGLPTGAAPAGHRRSSPCCVGAHVGRHRRAAQGHPRRQRGHLDDHAERDRDRAGRLLPAQGRRAGRRQQQHRHRADRRVRPPRRAAARARTPPLEVFGFLPVAVLVGVGYWLLLGRTRFGFDLRATGRSESAAPSPAASTSSAWSSRPCCCPARSPGWSACPSCSARRTRYSLDFPAGLGFTGIAIALLGRNHPVGIAFGALLWAYLDVSSVILDIEGVSRGDRHDHAGHRSCCRSSSPTSWCAATGCAPSSAASAQRARPQRRAPTGGGRHDRRPRVPEPRVARRVDADACAGRRGRALTRLAAAARRRRAVVLLVARARGHRRRRHHLERHGRGRARRWPCPSAWPAWAGCGPSAPASSTSASRAC